MTQEEIAEYEAKAYQNWVKECNEKVKSMGDAVRLICDLYRGYCPNKDNDALVCVTMPKEMQLSYIGWMLDQMRENADIWPVDKLNRWVGYVQAVLMFHGLTTVEEERKRTRPIFHAYYHREGIIPPTPVNMA